MATMTGIIIQPYCAELPSADRFGTFEALANRARRAGCAGVASHGFPHELPGKWPAYARAAANAGLPILAAWGLDASSVTPEEKGREVGQLAKDPACVATLADCEGYWDARHEDDALTFGEALRSEAPSVLVADQCWFAIESHADERVDPLPIGKGGPEAGFPVDEFAARAVDWYRLRQLYCNEAGFKSRWGEERYARCEAWMDRDWAMADRHLTAAGLHRPLGVTLQGYGWRPRDLSYALLKYAVMRAGPLPVWCERQVSQGLPEPAPDVWAAIRFVQFLADPTRRFAGVGTDPNAAVLAFQQAYNKRAAASAQLDTDGWAGVKTWAAAGIVPGQPF